MIFTTLFLLGTPHDGVRRYSERDLFVICYGPDFFPLSFGNRKKRFRTDKLAPDGIRRYSEGEICS